MAKMEKDIEDVYSIPGIREIEKEFINSMMSSDPKYLDKGSEIIANATKELAGLGDDVSSEDRKKEVTKLIEKVASDFEQLRGSKFDPGPSESLKKMFEKENEDTKTE
jgi:hypothetical protein